MRAPSLKRAPDQIRYGCRNSYLEATWQKYKKYYYKVDNTSAYYIAIIFNLILKIQQFQNNQGKYKYKVQILKVKAFIRELQLKYKGKL